MKFFKFDKKQFTTQQIHSHPKTLGIFQPQIAPATFFISGLQKKNWIRQKEEKKVIHNISLTLIL